MYFLLCKGTTKTLPMPRLDRKWHLTWLALELFLWNELKSWTGGFCNLVSSLSWFLCYNVVMIGLIIIIYNSDQEEHLIKIY